MLRTLCLILSVGLMVAGVVVGCRAQQTTVIAVPGVPMKTLQPFTAPAGAVATEVARGKYVPNTGATQIPAGATIIVLPAPGTAPVP